MKIANWRRPLTREQRPVGSQCPQIRPCRTSVATLGACLMLALRYRNFPPLLIRMIANTLGWRFRLSVGNIRIVDVSRHGKHR